MLKQVIAILNDILGTGEGELEPDTVPTMADIGILASTDPVALDKACVDLVYAAPDGQDLIRHIESRYSMRILEYAVEMGFGSLDYELVSIDV